MTKVLSFCGSLRQASVNRKLLNIAAKLTKEAGHEYEEFDLRKHELPFYNQDIENAGLPEVVQNLKQKIKDADVVLLASPEYNHSVTGILKNMIDWASRPYGDNSLDGKKIVIIGASPSRHGTARGQKHLREILEPLSITLVGKPDEVCIDNAYEAFDDKNQLIDQANFNKVKDLIGQI